MASSYLGVLVLFCVPVLAASQETDPCQNYFCPSGQICRTLYALCRPNPCPPIATCHNVTRNPCENYRCPFGQYCRSERENCGRDVCPFRAVCYDIVKPGKCPAPKGFSTCVDTCATDKSCPGTEKCCNTGCALGCVDVHKNTNTDDLCKDYFCPYGQLCRKTFVLCRPNPCPPRPMCHDDPNFENPCKNYQCPGQECRLQRVACIRSPCPAMPVCRDISNTADVCRVGKPVLNMGGMFPYYCQNDVSCPDKTMCDRRFGVCCLKSQTGFTTPSPPPPPPRPVKSGYCPRDYSLPRQFCFFIQPCTSDSVCPGTMKCCYSSKCGQRKCMVPNRSKRCSFFGWILGTCDGVLFA